MPTGREVIDTIKEAFELFSEMELPLKEREVTIMYAAALPLIGYIERLEAAQPEWISVVHDPPAEGEIVFVHDPDEGWIALVKVIRVNLASIDAIGIYPEYSVPFNAKVWMPLRFPEAPKEEL